MDNLKRRCHIIVNGCHVCLADEETVNHLLVPYGFATRVWATVFASSGAADHAKSSF